MEGLKQLIANRLPKKKPPKYQWQELAMEIIKSIPDSYTVSSSVIFRTCKMNPGAAKNALIDCRELSKCYIKYYLKVWNSLNKKV